MFIDVSRKTVHRTMHAARKGSNAGKQHIPLSGIKFRRLAADDRKLHADNHYSHAWWDAGMRMAFSSQ